MIRESILDNVATTLRGISRDNGYNTDVATVQRKVISEFKIAPNEYPALGVLWKRDEKDTQGMPHDYIESDMVLTIRGILQLKEDLETELNLFLEDIEKVMAVDYTRGGYTTLCDPISVVPFIGERDDLIYFDFDFLVRYHYVWGNP